jgi:CheY-like chemotaxis protein
MNPKTVGVLLVEDNADHVELISKVLGDSKVMNGLHVVTSGEEALDFLCRRGEHADAPRPALILLDIKLPKVNGIEVLRRIKADAELKSIPVVMLTTSAGNEEMIKSYNYGANSYIVKPVDFEQFVKLIKDLRLYWLAINSLPV